MDATWRNRVLDYLQDDVGDREDPRQRGKALAGPMVGLWRYRVGDYRIICQIQDRQMVVLALAIGHRSEIYR